MEGRNEGGEEEKGGWNMASEVPRDRNCPLDNHKVADNKINCHTMFFCEATILLIIALFGKFQQRGKGTRRMTRRRLHYKLTCAC